MEKAAIFILSPGALPNAQKVAQAFTNSTIYATDKVNSPDCDRVSDLTNTLRNAFLENQHIIAFCATGIVVRLLAPLLKDKFTESPVICVAEDASSVVPLLGANKGANHIANKIADVLHGTAAITTSGELRFGVNLLYPPQDLELINPNAAKSFIAALLAGEKVQILGNHRWLENAKLPIAKEAKYKIILNSFDENHDENCLYYKEKVPTKAGRLTVIGLGPGDKKYLTESAKIALAQASDIFGYDFYIKLAGPFLPHQTIHTSDNRQEMERSLHALQMASEGNNVAIVSSGDPGVFAMATAVMEAMENNKSNDLWKSVNISIEPGITAAHAAASHIGAPLGHDFVVISLSDNLKPWSVIEKRLLAAISADFAMALYNPVSKARPGQIQKTFDLLKKHCDGDRIVVVATDIARVNETTLITTLDTVKSSDVTSRSVLLIGSSQTRCFDFGKRQYVYTPRSYHL